MIARPAGDAEICNVLWRLAPERKAELTASTWHDSAAQLASEIIAVRRMAGDGRPAAELWSLFGLDSTVPAAIVGVVPFGPGLGGMIWAAAPEWAAIALASHRWWRRFFVPQVLGRYRRVEFTALAADVDSRKWLAGLGFTEEGIAYRQGKRGEDFVHFAWINPDREVAILV